MTIGSNDVHSPTVQLTISKRNEAKIDRQKQTNKQIEIKINCNETGTEATETQGRKSES